MFKHLVLVLGFVLATPLYAQTVSEADKTALAARVDAFVGVFETETYGDTVDFLPPKLISFLIDAIGKQGKTITEQQLRSALAEQIRSIFSTVTLETFGMDVENAQYGVSASGTPYAVIPTETVMHSASTGRVRMTSETLALVDSGVWYLVRIEGPEQGEMVRDVYPELKDLVFHEGTVTNLD